MTVINDMLDINNDFVAALTALFESVDAAEGDFCGEQREWHLPRLKLAAATMSKLFPSHSVRAIAQAKSPYETLKSNENATDTTD